MSAQEDHVQDDEERARRQEPDEHADPQRPPRTTDRDPTERQHPGGNPGDPAAVPVSDEEDEHGSTEAERVQKRAGGTLEDGSQLPR
jgi:hypothetical protein